MNIDDLLLSKLEKLSALKIADEKREETKENLSEIVAFVEILNELDLSSCEATVSTVNASSPFREDMAIKSDVVGTVLANSPKHDENFFIVPKVIE